MELRQLRYLLAVAEEGHMGRAAERVHITQPGLSQQLRKLERELGVSLIERHSKGVRLSIAGAAVLPFFRNALRQLHDARDALSDLSQSPQGRVEVGSLQAINVEMLPAAVARVVDLHPEVRVRVQEMAASEIELGIEQGQLDFGVSFLPVNRYPEGFDTEPLLEDELVLLINRDHPLAARRQCALADLQGVPLALLPTRFQIRRILDEAIAACGLTPEVVVEMDTTQSLLGVVRQAGLGTILPAMAAPRSARDLKRISLVDPAPVCSVGLIWRRSGFRSSAARALAAELQALSAGYHRRPQRRRNAGPN